MNFHSNSVKHMHAPRWGDASTQFTPASMGALAGEFAIATDLKERFLTAVNGGGKTTDVIHTDAVFPQAWETFKIWVDTATGELFAFQTVDGHFITAVDAGGLTTDTIHSDATVIDRWEMFKLLPQTFPNFAIQTLRGFLPTAVGGGGHDSGNTIHTNAVNADSWERFSIFKLSPGLAQADFE